MTTKKKLDELCEWGSQEKRPPFPSYLLPNNDDIQALVYREEYAMRYFIRLLCDMIEEIEQLRGTVTALQKKIEEKVS